MSRIGSPTSVLPARDYYRGDMTPAGEFNGKRGPEDDVILVKGGAHAAAEGMVVSEGDVNRPEDLLGFEDIVGP